MSTKKVTPPRKPAPSPKKKQQVAPHPIPRSAITPHCTQHTKVGDIGIEVVATIAAHLPPEIDAPDAVRRAYQILEYASAGRHGEVSLQGYEAGIQQLLEAQGTISKIVEWQEGLPRDLFQQLPGEVVTAPLDDVLANLMPRHETKYRLPLFMRWVVDCEIGHGEDESIKDLMPEAERLVAPWKTTGVPESTYLMARDQFGDFLRRMQHEKHSRNGTAGAEAKKGKQGQVKKKTDKRTGSRLPGEKSPRSKISR